MISTPSELTPLPHTPSPSILPDNDTVVPIIIYEYSRQYKFCNESLIITCPSSSGPGPQITPTQVTTPTQMTTPTQVTTPTYPLLTSFPISVTVSLSSALFIVMVAAVLVLVVVLCVRRKRELIERVDRSGEYHQQCHGTSMGLGIGNSTRGVHGHSVSSPDQIFVAADELHYRYT